MYENICLQCNRLPNGPSHRLVRDSCGHEKCRVCLLEDENECKQCEYSPKSALKECLNINKSEKCDINGKLHSEAVTNNHAGVIQINGNVPSTSNLNGEFKLQLTNVNNTEKVDEILSENINESISNSLKVENKNIEGTKIKKPDKQKGIKRSYSSIIIPKHVSVNLDPLSYHCTICNKTFTTKTNVKYHVYCAGASKPYKCEVCGKEFILRAQLDVHSYKHKSFKPYSCHICKKSFGERSKLARHSAIHSNVKSHICSVCGNAYRSKESLKIHSVTHKTEKPYSCKLCSAKFSSQMYLNKHGLVHKKERVHMCDLCGKRYKQKWALTVHKSSHIRGKVFECNLCLKKFNYSKDLQRHNLIHVETKQYKCSICLTTFRRKDNLQRHMKNTHAGKQGEVLKNIFPTATTSATSTTCIVKSAKNFIENRAICNDNKPIDNPNAINVITTVNPSRVDIGPISIPSAPKSDSRAAGSGSDSHKSTGNNASTTVINGPLKLAFKTPAFKSNYNINRDFDYMSHGIQLQNTYNMAESVEICQKIMSTDTTLPAQNIIRKAAPSLSTEICKKILDPNLTAPLHYETSFQNKKPALNIKFKVPVEYTNQFKDKKNLRTNDDESNVMFRELRPASVIVNSNDLGESGNLHWRRRTSQNLSLKS